MIQPIETASSVLHYNTLEKQIWREISMLTDFRLIKEKLKKEARSANLAMTDEFASQKAKDIQYCIKQAKEYFLSSKSATLVIKPTLIYYGLISLAAALVIVRDRDKSLNSMRGAHGLKDKYPDKLNSVANSTISRNEILEISAEIQDSGTFAEIIRMNLHEGFTLPIKHEGSTDTTKDFKQQVNYAGSYPTLKEINLLSIFQNIPEIWKETKLVLKKESFVYMGEAVLSGEIITCRISKELNTIDELERNFSFTARATVAESNNYYFFNIPRSQYTDITPLTKRDTTATQYLTADKNNPLITSDFILYYLSFFLLGSLARYKPALWRYILEDPMHGLSTIPEILCDSAYIKLPYLFLNEFNNNFYKI
ncbi:YaaC family protein [Mucilaginibacter sp. RCC_168]|uniref:YaaC family protein n=1 Tax=Mucilaginibacter sp. RCC_168 TaxID=3239221 RepID=UPI003523C772